MRMRTAKHYEELLDENPNASIGYTLAASAVYAARYGVCEAEDRSTEEYKLLARDLKNKYGLVLTADEVRERMKWFIYKHQRESKGY